MGLPDRAAGPGQELLPAGRLAMRAGHVRGMAARRRAARLTGELAAAGRLPPGAGCMRCNESGWLPGQAREVADGAEARRVPRSCGAGRATLTGPPVMHPVQPAAPGCIAAPAGATMMHAAQRHRPHHRCIGSRRDHEVPGHRSRKALRQAGAPHATPQAARVHAKCRMLHLMQLRALWCESQTCGGAGGGGHEGTAALTCCGSGLRSARIPSARP